MPNNRIAVIGSGLAAVSACKVLISRGMRPVVLDVGDLLDDQRALAVDRMSRLSPQQWCNDDRMLVTKNASMHGGNYPKKLAFGSDYFYARPHEAAMVYEGENYPPFSFAKGGFSVGWGASVLPPDDCDIQDWPVGNRELRPYFHRALADLHYAAVNDGLAMKFPLLREPDSEAKLTRGNLLLLQAMDASGIFEQDRLVFGRSRLLLNADANSEWACRNCGYCMSGCVYGAIYKSNHDIDQMIKNGEIEYRQGVKVDQLEETDTAVKVKYRLSDYSSVAMEFDRVFLAAGALNSTAIVMRSKGLYNLPVEIKTTVGFVAPMLSFRKLPVDWPNANTLPGIFLEFKVEGLSDHWVHTQLSTPNELVFEKLGWKFDDKGPVGRLKKALISHLVVAHCNLHSDHGNHYEIILKKRNDGLSDDVICSRQDAGRASEAIKRALQRLKQVAKKFGCYPIAPLVQDITRAHGYHLGGGLPMKPVPEKETDTDLLGRPKGWKRVHVVDSSVFPSIPGTTIGVLSMANAMRIVADVKL